MLSQAAAAGDPGALPASMSPPHRRHRQRHGRNGGAKQDGRGGRRHRCARGLFGPGSHGRRFGPPPPPATLLATTADPQNDWLSAVKTRPAYTDIKTTSVYQVGDSLRFEMELYTDVPDPWPTDGFYGWFVDTDSAATTGQHYNDIGSDYNVQLDYRAGRGWLGLIYSARRQSEDLHHVHHHGLKGDVDRSPVGARQPQDLPLRLHRPARGQPWLRGRGAEHGKRERVVAVKVGRQHSDRLCNSKIQISRMRPANEKTPSPSPVSTPPPSSPPRASTSARMTSPPTRPTEVAAQPGPRDRRPRGTGPIADAGTTMDAATSPPGTGGTSVDAALETMVSTKDANSTADSAVPSTTPDMAPIATADANLPVDFWHPTLRPRVCSSPSTRFRPRRRAHG